MITLTARLGVRYNAIGRTLPVGTEDQDYISKFNHQSEERTLPALEIGIALAAIKPLASSLYSLAKGIVLKNLGETSVAKLSACLTHRAKDISQVKTLLCLEQPVLITDFYSPQYIIDPVGERKALHGPEEIREFRRIVIAGVAGQGKSILFRYLALHELANKRLPLFVELRNYEHAKSIRALLFTEIATLGFPAEDTVLDLLLDSKTCTLLLDAFDEIPHTLQTKARKEIEDLARKHETCNILVSTRPTLSIESSNLFRVAKLDNLRPDEAKLALRNMCSDTDDVGEIEQELKDANHRIAGLLTTPLMVALLLLHHRLSGEFPETEQAFFGDLFDVLLRRHDQTKGYLRKRYSTASELELHDMFGYTSFACRQKGAVALPRNELVKVVDSGRDFYCKDFDSGKVLQDIIEGTNLVLEEGASCRFAHKAIQEFYAARFLTAQPDEDVRTFLSNRIQSWEQWEQLLEFIELINPNIFYKYFLIPHIGAVAFDDESKRLPDDWVPSKKTYVKIFGRDTIGVRDGNPMLFGCAHSTIFYLFKRRRTIIQPVVAATEELNWAEVPDDNSSEIVPTEFVPWTNGEDSFKLYTMKFLLEQQCGDHLRNALKPYLLSTIGDAKKAYQLVDLRAEQGGFFA